MDLYVAAARRPIRHGVKTHLERAAYEPEPPYHAAARGQERATLCGQPIGEALFAFADSAYDAQPGYARCPACEAKAR
jgi:hypothetical protein